MTTNWRKYLLSAPDLQLPSFAVEGVKMENLSHHLKPYMPWGDANLAGRGVETLFNLPPVIPARGLLAAVLFLDF